MIGALRASLSRLRGSALSRYHLAHYLGWISLAMGLTLLAPTRAARLFGLGPRPRLMCAIGMRDLVVGIGLLRQRRPAFWLRVHAGADAIDASLVARALLTGRMARWQGWPWLGLAVGGGLVSIARARQLDRAI